MATMVVLLLVPSLAILAVLVLVLTIHLSKSKRLGKTRATIRPRKAQIGMPRGGSSSRETCSMCGGLRLRSQNAATLDDATSPQSYDPQHFAVSDRVRQVRSKLSRKHWAAMKTQVATGIKHVVQKVLSHQRKQRQGEFLRWLKNLLYFSWRKVPAESKANHVTPTCVPTEECSLFSHAEACTGGGIASEVVCNAAKSDSALFGPGASSDLPSSEANFNPALFGPCASSDLPFSEANFNPAGLDVVKVQGHQGAADTDSNVAAIHRVILEILVSSTGNQDCRSRNSFSTSASDLTLKLEANSARGHLSVCAEAVKTKASQPDLAQATCLHRDSVFEAFGTQEQISQLSNEAVWGLDSHIPSPSEELMPFGNTLLETKAIARGNCSGSPVLDSKDCGEICRSLHDNTQGDSIKSVVSHAAPGKQCIVMEQLNFRTGNHTCKKVMFDTAPKSSAKGKESLAGSETTSARSLNGPGTVHIRVLKLDAQEECAEKLNRQAGSPLASLNVAEKPIGGSGLSDPKKEKLNTKAGVFSERICSLSPKSSVRWGDGVGNGPEQHRMERGDHPSLQALTDTSANDNFGSSSKKERRKKKSKRKKPKPKTAALMADSQEMQEVGKVALETAKHVSCVSERELGCVCGASRGDLHNETCPYPFTSSGSMLQRRIKEQYNDLVRSNASKTLTLAQVGQFTSCLVEVKAALQQKSESIQRKFTITKSLLSKADKSSFDRLCGQIHGLEMEQKKLEEDTVVYNRLQKQLKLSPAYKKMLEYGRAHFEVQPHTGQMIEKLDPEEPEISFEELLAQEKKDAFWQKRSLASSGVSAS